MTKQTENEMLRRMNGLWKEMINNDEPEVYCSDCGKRYSLNHICKEPPHNWAGDCEVCKELK